MRKIVLNWMRKAKSKRSRFPGQRNGGVVVDFQNLRMQTAFKAWTAS